MPQKVLACLEQHGCPLIRRRLGAPQGVPDSAWTTEHASSTSKVSRWMVREFWRITRTVRHQRRRYRFPGPLPSTS